MHDSWLCRIGTERGAQVDPTRLAGPIRYMPVPVRIVILGKRGGVGYTPSALQGADSMMTEDVLSADGASGGPAGRLSVCLTYRLSVPMSQLRESGTSVSDTSTGRDWRVMACGSWGRRADIWRPGHAQVLNGRLDNRLLCPEHMYLRSCRP